MMVISVKHYLACLVTFIKFQGLRELTTKDYIRAEHKLHSISKSFISLVIIPQVMFLASAGTQHGEPASNRVTYFILRAYTGSSVSHSQHRRKLGEVLEKMQVNGPEG